MDQNLNLKYNQNDTDITKYIYITIKNFKLIILCIVLFVIANFIINNNSEKIYATKIYVSEKSTLKFLLSPFTSKKLDLMGFSVSDFFLMQKDNFLNYERFLEDYETLDSNITERYSAKELFNSLQVVDIKENLDLNELESEYILTSSLNTSDGKEVLKKLIINSDKRTLDNLIFYFDRKIKEVKDLIEINRESHLNYVDISLKELNYEAELLLVKTRMEIQNEIDNLRHNLSISIKMGYEEPIVSEMLSILKNMSTKKSKDVTRNISSIPNSFLLGSKIIEDKITLLENELDDLKISNIAPTLASKIENINMLKADAFINAMQSLIKDLKELEIIHNEIKGIQSDYLDESILTMYNINRIVVDVKGRSILFTSLIAGLMGFIVGSLIAIVRYNILNRIKNDEEFALEFKSK